MSLAVQEAAPTTSPTPPQPRSMSEFLRPYLRQYKWPLAGALFLNFFHGFALTLQNLTPKYLIDNVLLNKSYTPHQRYVYLAWLVAIYLFASIVWRMLVWHVGFRLFTYVRERIVFSLRADFFKHVNHLCLRFHIKHHSGELFTYLFGSPLNQIQTYFSQWTYTVPGAACLLLSTLVWIGTWDWLLTAIILLLVTSNVLLMNHIRNRIQRLHADYQSAETNVSGYVADLLRGSRDVKLYAMETQVVSDFQARVWGIGEKAYRRDVRTHVEWMKTETVGYLCFALLCVACAWRYLHAQAHPEARQVTIGEIQAYLTSFIALQAPITQLFQVASQRGAAQASLDRINAVLTTASTTPDPVGRVETLPPKGDIVFYEVSFGYSPDEPVLNDLNLTIPYGQRVALVGPSGAGKSTLAQLLLRLYDPDQGAILVGGLNIRHCVGSELRKQFAVVPQDPFIFRTTIRHNLRVARPDATDSDLQRACELANAWEFISRLPQGLDSPIGEGGSTLSGGQRQRLAIARALLADQDFFIFDEATGALDTVSERLIHSALDTAMTGRTSIVIAHRLATVKNCDRILVLKDGRILQDGPYDLLATTPGLFRDLVQGQLLKS